MAPGSPPGCSSVGGMDHCRYGGEHIVATWA